MRRALSTSRLLRDRAHPAQASLVSRGYTLIEMLLVVGIIVLVAGLGWQPLMRLAREHRVREASEEVRVVAAGTRTQALDQDLTFQFRYEPGGRRFIRVPYEQPQSSGTNGQTATVRGQMTGYLPEGMTFQAISGVSDGGGINPAMTAGLSSEFTNVSWSGPVLFFADGTAVSATFDIVDEVSSTRRVTIRDLTGAVTVSNLSNN